MEVKYELKRMSNDDLIIKLMTTDLADENIVQLLSISKEDFIKTGNIIDRTTFPFRLCYVLLKEFQAKINAKIVSASQLVTDLDLQSKMIDYGKDILSSKIEVVSMEMFEKLLKELEEYEREIRKG